MVGRVEEAATLLHTIVSTKAGFWFFFWFNKPLMIVILMKQLVETSTIIMSLAISISMNR